jgi:hypothetical protein
VNGKSGPQAAPQPRQRSNADDSTDGAKPFDSETPAALRRRREESYRKPVLRSGFRDPLDELARDWPRDDAACRAAWHHLNDLGLMSEIVERVLAELVGAA